MAVSITKTSQLMLYREIIAVCSEIHTKHINALCGQNVEFVNVKPGGTYSNQWAFKELKCICLHIILCGSTLITLQEFATLFEESLKHPELQTSISVF
jgi:hypothetical protein